MVKPLVYYIYEIEKKIRELRHGVHFHYLKCSHANQLYGGSICGLKKFLTFPSRQTIIVV